MAKPNKEIPASDPVESVWTSIENETFEWGTDEKRFGDQTRHALTYLIKMGASQAFIDIEAGKAKFIGQKADGSAHDSPVKPAVREKVARELGVVGYDDSSIDARKSLAALHFGKKAETKWSDISDGTLTYGGGTSRLSPEDQLRCDIAMNWLDTWDKSKEHKFTWAAAMKAARERNPEIVAVKDGTLKRQVALAYAAKAMESVPEFLAEYTRRKNAAASMPQGDVDMSSFL
jgi:hypothetical protein